MTNKQRENRSQDYDPYNQGKYGVCQFCDVEGPLYWSNWFGYRVCADDAGC